LKAAFSNHSLTFKARSRELSQIDKESGHLWVPIFPNSSSLWCYWGRDITRNGKMVL